MATPFPDSGVLLGVDFGTKRVGLALCDAEQKVAVPLTLLTRRTPELDAHAIRAETQKHQVRGLVVGLPLHLRSGEEGKLARQARAFGEWLAAVTALPVTYVDERLTSAHAEELLLAAGLSSQARQQRLDKVAAQILLQTYLDERARTGASATPPRASSPSATAAE